MDSDRGTRRKWAARLSRRDFENLCLGWGTAFQLLGETMYRSSRDNQTGRTRFPGPAAARGAPRYWASGALGSDHLSVRRTCLGWTWRAHPAHVRHAPQVHPFPAPHIRAALRGGGHPYQFCAGQTPTRPRGGTTQSVAALHDTPGSGYDLSLPLRVANRPRRPAGDRNRGSGTHRPGG